MEAGIIDPEQVKLRRQINKKVVTRERDSSGKPEVGKVRERNLGSGPSGKSTAAPTLNPTTSPTLVRLETNLCIPAY